LKPALLIVWYFGFDRLSQRCLSLSKAVCVNKNFGGGQNVSDAHVILRSEATKNP